MEQEKKHKNILGYDAETMNSANRRSRYFVGVAMALTILVVLGNPLFELLGTLLLAPISAQLVAWIARLIAKAFGKKGNKFDYFATTFLTMSIIAFISKLLG